MTEALRAVARATGAKFNASRLAPRAPRVFMPSAVVTTLAAREQIVSKVRTAKEFKASGSRAVVAPPKPAAPYAWSLKDIRAARDAQLRGEFASPVRLAEAMRTDDALFTAYHNRIAPQAAVQTTLVPHASTRGKRVAAKAADSVHIARSVLEGLAGTLANHGVAIGYIERETNDTGSCIDFRLTEWPLEFVRWDRTFESLMTQTKEGPRELITHGDGRWVVIRKFHTMPWAQEACILPAAFIWAAHANGIKDWALASTSHGQAKIVGKLPEGVSLQDDGALTPEAAGFLALLQDLVSGEGGAGIAPFGSDVDFMANGSTAWQVFSELILNREKAAARVYLGTDAMMGAAGGAPGVDISALFGVATTKIQGDFSAIEQALATGVYQPWTAINEGDSRYAPRLEYMLPDPDAAAKSKQRAEARDRLTNAIKAMREQQLVVDQTVVNSLAAEFGVSPVPLLASQDAAAIPLQLAPADVAKVVRVSEARKAQGLQPFGDARDNMTITELDAATQAQAKAQASPPPAAAPIAQPTPAA